MGYTIKMFHVLHLHFDITFWLYFFWRNATWLNIYSFFTTSHFTSRNEIKAIISRKCSYMYISIGINISTCIKWLLFYRLYGLEATESKLLVINESVTVITAFLLDGIKSWNNSQSSCCARSLLCDRWTGLYMIWA